VSAYTVATIVIAAVWTLTGLVLSIVMARRGHLGVGWGVLGTMLGPLAVIAAVGTARHENEDRPEVIQPAADGGGPIDVLVGIDGSAECRVALGRTVDLFGSRLGRLCLATVVPFEDVSAHTARAIAELDRHARLSGVREVGEELLYGPPAHALSDFAQASGYDLLVIGTRGTGLSKAVVGSTASRLATNCPVPVLMVSGQCQASSVAA
jgi:nucleotide-binding universal stress UspA family protein